MIVTGNFICYLEKMERSLPPLYFCMDLIGCASFVIPGIGEFSDIIWAPVSAYIFYRSFGGRFGVFGAVLNFIEEALPFTDIVPSFTIAYFLRRPFFKNRPAVKAG